MKKRKDIENNRSLLNTSSFIKWFRSRYKKSNTIKNNCYLYFPDQLMKETSIEQIFKEFDADDSGGLSRDQIYDMFNDYGIPITMDDLNQLYDSVQIDLKELNSNMFKKCALSDASDRVFRQIIHNLACKNPNSPKYMPHSFINMIIYLVYLSKRQQLRNTNLRESQTIFQKVKSMQRLLKLKGLTHNNQNLNSHTEDYKHQLKNSFMNIWEELDEKYQNKFSYNSKLQSQFYQYYLKNSNSDTINKN